MSQLKKTLQQVQHAELLVQYRLPAFDTPAPGAKLADQ